jgi:hypothetical protein
MQEPNPTPRSRIIKWVLGGIVAAAIVATVYLLILTPKEMEGQTPPSAINQDSD